MSDGEALKLGRDNSCSNCRAMFILATIRHKVLFSARFKLSLVEIVCKGLSQKRAIESIGRRYWLYQGLMVLCSNLLHACGRQGRANRKQDYHFAHMSSIAELDAKQNKSDTLEEGKAYDCH